jgi:hypothetical protein
VTRCTLPTGDILRWGTASTKLKPRNGLDTRVYALSHRDTPPSNHGNSRISLPKEASLVAPEEIIQPVAWKVTLQPESPLD